MTFNTQNRRFNRLATLGTAAIGLVALSIPLAPAKAQYLGWDFGNGVGIGLGTPPSAYGYHPYNYPGYYYGYRPYYRPYYYPW